jgi:hypothetical protein
MTHALPVNSHPKNYVFEDELSLDKDLPHSKSPALEFQVRAVAGQARAAQMQLPHFLCETPMFMPVGTQGAFIKTIYAFFVSRRYNWQSWRCSKWCPMEATIHVVIFPLTTFVHVLRTVCNCVLWLCT